tara:strand:- start:5323 stop:5535 length:213 start_codon:yes stop_codon:yes gene_type:complete
LGLELKCAKCGKTATIYNAQQMPVCSRHVKNKIKVPSCPSCGIEMMLRESKYGKFWGCKAFPMCDGLKKI